MNDVQAWLMFAAGLVTGVLWVLGTYAWRSMHGKPRANAGQQLVKAATGSRDLADWCRQTNLTVIAVTGTEFTISLADLANSAHPYRSWNVPVSAAVWSAKDLTPPTPEEARV